MSMQSFRTQQSHAVPVSRVRDRRLHRAARAGLAGGFERLEDRTLFALTVTPYNPANPISTLTSALVKANTGITVTNTTYVGINGQGGTYKGLSVSDGTNSLSLADGVILTSGLANNALGPNDDSGVSASDNGPGDADLTTLISGSGTTIDTHDANSITLTFTATAKTKSVAFDFVFGSDEFPEFVGDFNDAFGAFLDGKQISFDSNKNPITVNNNFFKLNNTNPTDTTDTDTAGKTVVHFNLQYDGLTPVLSTKANLDTTKTTHTLKLTIADAADTALDSGVFIAQLRGDDTGGGGTGQPPTAKPGGPYTVVQGGTVVLDGSKSTDPNQSSASLTYQWDLDGDGIFGETGANATNGNETGSKPTFAAGGLAVGTVKTVSLKVTDNTNLSSTATTTVTVIKGGTTVIANAGGPYTINEGSSLPLSAASSTAPAGATFSWDVDGDGTFGDATGISPTLTWTQLKAIGIIDGNATSVYTAKVKITDNGTATISPGTTVTVKNVAPAANAGPDKTTNVNSAVALNGSFTDPGDADTHTFAWSVKNSGGQVVATSTLQNFNFTPTAAGTYTATLTVKDDDGGVDTDSALINATSITTGPSVVSFTLVDADTDKDIMTLTDGITLDLSKLPRRLNVRANTSPTKVGSCAVAVDGHSHIERQVPYALFYDNAADYAAATFKAGKHTLAAKAFTGPDGTGIAGALKQITIHVVNQPPAAVGVVKSIILFNADTNQDIMTLHDFDELDLKSLPKHLGFRVTTSGSVGSITYVVDAHVGVPATNALKGAGWHTLTALPFTGAGGAGTLGASLQVRLFIVP